MRYPSDSEVGFNYLAWCLKPNLWDVTINIKYRILWFLFIYVFIANIFFIIAGISLLLFLYDQNIYSSRIFTFNDFYVPMKYSIGFGSILGLLEWNSFNRILKKYNADLQAQNASRKPPAQ